VRTYPVWLKNGAKSCGFAIIGKLPPNGGAEWTSSLAIESRSSRAMSESWSMEGMAKGRAGRSSRSGRPAHAPARIPDSSGQTNRWLDSIAPPLHLAQSWPAVSQGEAHGRGHPAPVASARLGVGGTQSGHQVAADDRRRRPHAGHSPSVNPRLLTAGPRCPRSSQPI
jgi:hypothetical protein